MAITTILINRNNVKMHKQKLEIPMRDMSAKQYMKNQKNELFSLFPLLIKT